VKCKNKGCEEYAFTGECAKCRNAKIVDPVTEPVARINAKPTADLAQAVAEALHESGNALTPLSILVGPYIGDAEARSTFAEITGRLIASNAALRNALRAYHDGLKA
jgi:hypothetical protein